MAEPYYAAISGAVNDLSRTQAALAMQMERVLNSPAFDGRAQILAELQDFWADMGRQLGVCGKRWGICGRV